MNMQDYLFIYLFRFSDETQFLIFFQTKKLKIKYNVIISSLYKRYYFLSISLFLCMHLF